MTESLLKSDIFFFITTLAVIAVSLVLVISLVYIIRILDDLKVLSRKAKDEGEKILDDVRFIREGAEDNGVLFGRFLSSFFAGRAKKDRRSASGKKDRDV